jgi:hypothetical protein
MRGPKMGSLFEQTGGIGIDADAMRGSLAGELGLNLGRDINGDRYAGLPVFKKGSFFRAVPTLLHRPCRRQQLTGYYKITCIIFGHSRSAHRQKPLDMRVPRFLKIRHRTEIDRAPFE